MQSQVFPRELLSDMLLVGAATAADYPAIGEPMRHTVLSRTAAAGGAVLLGLAGLAAAAPAYAATPGHVDIRVELDLEIGGVSIDDGPAVFEVTDVAIGAGPELTGADLIDNPSEWCGSVTVDVDPAARTITVAAERECNFSDVRVWVSSPEFTKVTFVSDDLLSPYEPEGCEGECGEGAVPLDLPIQEPTDEPADDPVDESDELPVALGVGGVGPGGIAAMALPVPRAAPGSLSALSWNFAAPQLASTWHVDQAGYEGTPPRTEFLTGSTVFAYTTGLASTGFDPAPLLLGAGALMLLGAGAVVLVGRRHETA